MRDILTRLRNEHTLPGGFVTSTPLFFVSPPLLHGQMDVTRSTPGTLLAPSGADVVRLQSVQQASLSPNVTIPASVRAVDTVRTVWSSNPFGDVPSTEAPTTGVLQYTLRDAATGADIPLTVANSSTLSSAMPFQFWMEVQSGA